jgi:hypothetical protein
MNPETSHKIKHRTKANDVIYTPLLVAQTHIKSIDSKPEEVWYDPFKGKGVYYNNFPTPNKVWTEISEGKDFFTFEGKVDIICSNPPYSCMDEVLKKSVELKPRVISFLLLEGKITPKRMEYMSKAGYGLSGMYMCKVFSWYGMAIAYTFTKGAQNEPKVIYDRIVHRDIKDEPSKK